MTGWGQGSNHAIDSTISAAPAVRAAVLNSKREAGAVKRCGLRSMQMPKEVRVLVFEGREGEGKGVMVVSTSGDEEDAGIEGGGRGGAKGSSTVIHPLGDSLAHDSSVMYRCVLR